MSSTIAFVMDPMERVDVNADTSFAFMVAAQERGFRVMHVLPTDLHLEHDRVFLSGRAIEVVKKQGDHFRVIETTRVADTDCAAIFIRTDPPFDEAYLTTTWILSFAEKRGVRVINSTRGLREANEHLYSLHFPELCPRTLITSSRDEVIRFVDSVGGAAIGKPIDGHGGFGVVKLSKNDSNMNALVDMLSSEGKAPFMVQEFVPEGMEGDKRVFFIDGKLRGAIKRIPAQGDHRGNVHVGGTVEAVELDDDDRNVERIMGERMRADGLFFVGLDVIGNRLIEVNVTSPTLIQELRDLGGPDLASEVIDSIQR